MLNSSKYRVYEYYIKENSKGEFNEDDSILYTNKAWTSNIEEAQKVFSSLQCSILDIEEKSNNPHIRNSASHTKKYKVKVFHTLEIWKDFSNFEQEIACNLKY